MSETLLEVEDNTLTREEASSFVDEWDRSQFLEDYGTSSVAFPWNHTVRALGLDDDSVEDEEALQYRVSASLSKAISEGSRDEVIEALIEDSVIDEREEVKDDDDLLKKVIDIVKPIWAGATIERSS